MVRVEGEVQVPGSKSLSIRAIMAASLAEGTSVIENVNLCDDVKAIIHAMEGVGVQIARDGTTLVVEGPLKIEKEVELNCGESALCARMLAPIAALYDAPVIITGDKTLLKRPMGMIEGPLSVLGAEVMTKMTRLPITIHGPITGGHIKIVELITSQFVTGLMFALPLCKEDSEMIIEEMVSSDYLVLTEEVLEAFGAKIETLDDGYKMKGGQTYTPCEFDVEGDWSGAAFLLVLGGVAGKVTVKGLSLPSHQPDRAICDALLSAGAAIEVDGDSVTCYKDPDRTFAGLNGFYFDATDCPDLFPPLVALALNCNGFTEIKGVDRLTHKEVDRAKTLKEEFGKLGASIAIEGDVMRINGSKLKGGKVSSRGDHRMAMAFGITQLITGKEIEIKDADSVTKSYPQFFWDLETLEVKE